MKLVFWIAVAWLGYAYVGYALVLWLLGFVRKVRAKTDATYFPSVSVLISARNEEKDIRWKVRETLAWNYPADKLQVLVASDASEDRTDEILNSLRDHRLTVLRMPKRVGKNAVLNYLATLACGDLLFFTDANSHIDGDCLRRMVRYFADPSVGCVTGIEDTAPNERVTAIGSGGKTYFGCESAIDLLESRIGSVLDCDGSIFCMRRFLFTELDPDVANDLALPLRIGGAGFHLLFEPSARSLEKQTSSPHEEFNRRRRICGQGILAMWKLRACLRGLRGWQFFSRKFLRWLTPVPMIALLVTTTASATWLPFTFLLALQVIFYSLALAGWLTNLRGGSGHLVVHLPFFFVLSVTAAMVGVVETCFGRRFRVWEVASFSRGRREAIDY